MQQKNRQETRELIKKSNFVGLKQLNYQVKYVDKANNLKKLQKKELEILKYFDEFCRKNGLEYYLAYGTLIGAIRHKGFIPWDDDIDIHMTGKMYLKLIELMKDKQDQQYFFQSLETDENYYLLWNKIRLNNTVFIEKGWEQNKFHQGIFIDIFPLIEYPKNQLDFKKINIIFKMTNLLIGNNLSENKKNKYYSLTGKLLSKMLRVIPKKIRNKIVIKNIKYLCNYQGDGRSYFSTIRGTSRCFKKENFDETIDVDFENIKSKAPKGYHEYLTDIYGDYMKLPKESERVGHGEVYLCFNTKNKQK